MTPLRKGLLHVAAIASLITLASIGGMNLLEKKVSTAELQFVEYSPVLGEDAGAIIPASCESSVQHGSECVPPAPTGLWASPGSCGTGQVYLAWNPSSWATNYRVYEYNWGTGAWVHVLNTGTNNSTWRGGPAPGSYNAYTIIAENSWGSSGYSNTAYVTYPNPCQSAVATPTGFAGTYNCATQNITLNWNPSNGASQYEVHVYDPMGWMTGIDFPTLGRTALTTFTINRYDSRMPSDYGMGSHDFYVYGLNNSGVWSNGAAHAQVPVSGPCAPATPQNLRGFPEACGTGKINLYWDASPGATSYKVYMHNGSQWVNIASPVGNSQPVTGLIANNPYTFTVTAVNSAGESNMHPQIWVTSPNVCAPTTPTGLSAVAGACSSGVVNLSWNAVSGATYYVVSRHNGSTWQLVASPTVTSYAVTGLMQDNPSTFTVQAGNDSGVSNMAPQVWATPPSCKPIGDIDGNCTGIWGWTCDQDNWNAALDVHMYEGGTFLGNTTANKPYDWIAPVCGGTTAHFFDWYIPNSMKTGTSRTINVYPINIPSGNNVPIESFTFACGMPDFTASLPTVSVASVSQGGNVTFYTNNIGNSGAEAAGPHNVGGFYVDYNGDGTADYTAAIPRTTTSLAPISTYSRSITWTVPTNAPPGANYRVGYIVDVSNEVAESNEGNNFSGWSAPFSVTLQNCAAATVSNCVMPLTQSGQSAGACAAGYAGSCSYACGGNPATWSLSSNSCAAPLITQFEICLWDGTTATSCGSSLTVATGTPLAIRWNSQNADNCARQSGPADFSTGGAVSGIDTTVNASSNVNTTSTYTLICTRGGNAVTAALRSVSNTTFNARPDLRLSERVVQTGNQITVSWDTNNGNEGACTLTGGGLTSATLTNGTGDAETGSSNVTIQGETTFTLTCQQSDVETVTVIPREWET